MKKKIIYILLTLVLMSGSVFTTWFFINSKETKVSLKSFNIYGVEVDVNNRHVFRVDLKNVDIKKPNVVGNTCLGAFSHTCSKGDDCLETFAMGYDKKTETLQIYLVTDKKVNYNTSKVLGTYGVYDYYIEVYNIDKEKVKEAGYCFDEYITEN